jgi:hypothetical protein
MDDKRWQLFWSLVDMSGGDYGCWPWVGSKMAHGYGRFWTGGAYVTAHRLARLGAAAIGSSSPTVCHSCDNPICCNPGHLFLGSQTDNLDDMWRKNRGRFGREHYAAKITEAEAVEIRARYAAGGISQRALGEMYGLTQQGVWCVIHKNWDRAIRTRP